MKPRIEAIALLLGTVVPAQGPVFPVDDLLAQPPRRAQYVAATVVLPAPPSLDWIAADPDGGDRDVLRHVVSGEGHLLACAGGGSARNPVLGEQALLDVLSALQPSAAGAFRVTRAGGSFFARARRAPEQLEVGLGVIRSAVPPPLTVTLRLERIVAGAAEPLLSAVEVLGFGDVAAVGDVERSALIGDLGVEIAQSAMTSNPNVVAVTRGTSALVRARPLPGRQAAVVEFVVRKIGAFDGAAMPGANVSGAVDRICNRIDQAGLAFRVDRGAESVHEWATLDGDRLVLRCRVDWPAAVPTPIVPLLCSPLLREPILGFRSSRSVEGDEPRDGYSVAEIVNEEFEWASDRGEVPVRRFDGGEAAAPFLFFAGAEGERLAQRIAERVDGLLAARRIEVEVFDVADGQAPQDAPPIWRFAGPALVGLPSCFASGREQTYMRDWDVEVAQSARMPDPKVSLVEEGWFATAKVVPADARGERRLELMLDAVRLVSMPQRTIVLSPELVGSTRDAKVELPREEVTIEQPVTRVLSFDTSFTLNERGEAEQRRVAPGLLGAGRELLVRVRVE